MLGKCQKGLTCSLVLPVKHNTWQQTPSRSVLPPGVACRAPAALGTSSTPLIFACRFLCLSKCLVKMLVGFLKVHPILSRFFSVHILLSVLRLFLRPLASGHDALVNLKHLLTKRNCSLSNVCLVTL